MTVNVTKIVPNSVKQTIQNDTQLIDNTAAFALPEFHNYFDKNSLWPARSYLQVFTHMFYFCAAHCTQTIITDLLLFRRLIASGEELRANILDNSAGVFRFDLEYELDYETVSCK